VSYLPRRITVPSNVPDILKCKNEECIHYAKFIKAEPGENGGAICTYTCPTCETSFQKLYKI